MAVNPFDLIKQFGNIQEKMTEVQNRLKEIQVTGSSGGDMIQVEINGHMEIIKVHISEEAVDPKDIVMLEDLIQAAFSDALSKAKERIRQEMLSVTGGINLPPGLMSF
jgi:DNA-binding YbaB/EbfC family protein